MDARDNIRMVLVEPQDDINIGTALRACKNFALRDFCLVRPAYGQHQQILISAPKADDYLQDALVTESLEEALADRQLVLATTARARADKTLVLEPRSAAALAINEAKAGHKVAFLFGREDSGLPNEVVDRAHAVITIPTNPDYSSLNLGQAVLLNAWEIFRLATDQPLELPELAQPEEDALPPAQLEAIDRMIAQAEEGLRAIEFFKTPSTRHITRTLRHVFQRARLDQREVAIFHGIFKEISAYMRRMGIHPDDDHSA